MEMVVVAEGGVASSVAEGVVASSAAEEEHFR